MIILTSFEHNFIRFNDFGNVMYDVATNNIVEQVFGWLLPERMLSPYFMLYGLLEKIVNHQVRCKIKVNNDRSQIVPKAQTALDENIRKATGSYAFQWYGQANIDVDHPVATVTYIGENTNPMSNANTVDLSNSTCSCQYWQQTGIPCKHAVLPILDYITYCKNNKNSVVVEELLCNKKSDLKVTNINDLCIQSFVSSRLHVKMCKEMYNEIPEFYNWKLPGKNELVEAIEAKKKDFKQITLDTSKYTKKKHSNKRIPSVGENAYKNEKRRKQNLQIDNSQPIAVPSVA